MKIVKHQVFFSLGVFFLLSPLAAQNEYHVATLQDAVMLGLANSKVLSYQQLNMVANQRHAKHSIKPFLPALSFSFSENNNITFGGPDSRTKSVQFSVSQMVFDGGKSKLEYKLGNINALYAGFEYQSAVKQYETEIINRYQQVLLQKRKMAIQTDLIANANTQLAIIKKEFELGLALETDYLEYAISVSEIEIEARQLETSLEKQYRELGILLGLPHGVRLVFDDDITQVKSYSPLESFLDTLWNIIRAASRELEKQQISFMYQKKQAALARNLLLPNLSLEGSVNFSGISYPLTQPSYSLKFNIAFNNSLLPITASSGLSAKSQRLNGSQSSISTTFPNSTTYFTDQTINGIALLSSQLELENAEIMLHESVRDMVVSHDLMVSGFELQNQTISLVKRKIEIDTVRMNRGGLRRIDFLDELIDLAKKETALVETEFKIMAYERSLEIAASFPAGELWRCINDAAS
ncbi:hypothetical protein AGMMS50268_25740 [Spirochaetia bacterium]|nr:hypothetical protein AGMMS50268_25740 [Spirochaetia bacterium]